MRRWITVAVAVAAGIGCGGRREPTPASHPARDATAPAPVLVDASPVAIVCEQLPFVETVSVPEASGSALMPIDGAAALVVAGDSGNHGAYVIIDPDTGAEREAGKLPLGGKADDVEGLATRDGGLYGLTSSGFVLKWKRASGKFALDDGPYPLADPSTGLSCGERDVNCGLNYEGICLRSGPVPDGECVGLAAAKADGALYCLVETAGRLVATKRTIPVTDGEKLTGCDVAPDGAVWAGTNLFGASVIYRITGWTTPESAVVAEIGPYGVGFPESIAVGPDDVVYRFSDIPTNGPSAVAKFRCPDPGR